jgi:hypothetical protein
LANGLILLSLLLVITALRLEQLVAGGALLQAEALQGTAHKRHIAGPLSNGIMSKWGAT